MSGQKRQLSQLTAAATRKGASKLQYYVRQVWGPGLVAPALGSRAPALLKGRGGGGGGSSRRRWRSCALAPIGVPRRRAGGSASLREARICPHCQLGVEDAVHIICDCPLYATPSAGAREPL